MSKLKHSFILIAIVLLSSLGFWQLERLKWKENLLTILSERLSKTPIALPLEPKDEFLRVSVQGKFMHEKESFFYIALPQGQGYFLFTPLELADGRIITVNRGFVPLSKKDPASRPETLIQELQTVTGFIRFSEKPTLFAAPNNPSTHVFYTRDIEKMRVAHNLAPKNFSIEQEATQNPLPQGGLSRVSFPNKHLDYALTWFSLALTLLVFYGIFIYRSRKEEEKK